MCVQKGLCRRFQARHVYTSLTLEIPAKMIIELQEVHRSYEGFLSRFLIFLSNKMIIVCKKWLVSQICNNLYRNHDYHPKLFPEFFRVVFGVKSKIPITWHESLPEKKLSWRLWIPNTRSILLISMKIARITKWR